MIYAVWTLIFFAIGWNAFIIMSYVREARTLGCRYVIRDVTDQLRRAINRILHRS
jgi:uncharacterized RDD family membrane protein YckC